MIRKNKTAGLPRAASFYSRLKARWRVNNARKRGPGDEYNVHAEGSTEEIGGWKDKSFSGLKPQKQNQLLRCYKSPELP